MNHIIDCFILYNDNPSTASFYETLKQNPSVNHIYWLLAPNQEAPKEFPEETICHLEGSPTSTASMKAIAQKAEARYILLQLKDTNIELGYRYLERTSSVLSDNGAVMLYTDHYSVVNGDTVKHPLIDYQAGSLRDDFGFGSIVMLRSDAFKEAAQTLSEAYDYAGWYAVRLALSRKGELFHLNEYLYTESELDTRKSGERQFDYVNPNNRKVQIEMEAAVTKHLEAEGALVDSAQYLTPDFSQGTFPVEASVIIPVYNRAKTIRDAVESALKQEASFTYNVIVIDNHSTDGTTKILNELAASNPSLVHLIPSRTDLGIGGCWNWGIYDNHCGRFAIQLDSDDLYSSPQTLQRIVDTFHEQKAAMVIGSYRMCDFDLNTLPPGLISHNEWTPENGCNNALRVNGLGSPRAFFTPLLREVGFPNTSYGEDYAMGLYFCRSYRIGRIYDELYLCRRWNGNSDASLSIEKENANNFYKDRLRTIEFEKRKSLNCNR